MVSAAAAAPAAAWAGVMVERAGSFLLAGLPSPPYPPLWWVFQRRRAVRALGWGCAADGWKRGTSLEKERKRRTGSYTAKILA